MNMTVEKINTLRRKILNEGYEPTDGELREAFEALREQRATASNTNTTAKRASAKAAEPIDLEALFKKDIK